MGSKTGTFPIKISGLPTTDTTITVHDYLKTINIRGSSANTYDQSFTKEVYFGSEIEYVDDQCCQNFTNLTSVRFNNVKHIGDYAFKNTSNLTDCDYLSANVFYSIGEQAFAGSGLRSIVLNIKGKNYTSPNDYQGCVETTKENGPYIGLSAFARCTSLTTVSLSTSTELAQSQFEGCTSLTTVNFANHGSCVGSYCFKGCTALTTMNLPERFEIISKGMFYGCTSLNTINIGPNNVSKDFIGIEADAFYGCTNLKSIIIPSTVMDVSLIDSNALRGSSIQTVTLKGIDSTVLSVYQSANISGSGKINTSGFDTTTTSDFKYGIFYHAAGIAMNVVDLATSNNIPLVVVRCNTGCGPCSKFGSYIVKSVKFQQWLSDSPYFFLYTDRSQYEASQDYLKIYGRLQKWGSSSSDGSWNQVCTGFPIVMLFWAKPDGTYVKYQETFRNVSESNGEQRVADFISTVDGKFNTYTRDNRFNANTYTVATSSTSSFTGWGRGADFNIISSDGKTFKFTNATSSLKQS